ncbi:TonB-linked SusC/RagA family outer membrane protein [Sphingobacterium sp. JUb20]|nr:TonB-linked SusC/RagA family outer membrane protein [Sphingobacterium sp. JUb20]
MPFSQVLKQVGEQAGMDRIGNKKLIDKAKPVTLNVKAKPLAEVLKDLSKGQPLELILQNGAIIIKERPLNNSDRSSSPERTSSMQQKGCVTGIVVDTLGSPIPGATIIIANTNLKASTDKLGQFSFDEIDSKASISLSSMGFHSTEIPVRDLFAIEIGKQKIFRKSRVIRSSDCNFTFILAVAANMLGTAEVNMGLFSRKQESFTGVTRTLSGDEIRTVNRKSLLDALSTLDPSFKIVRDNSLGSDPNQAPKIEFRGTRSMTPPKTEGYSNQLRLQYEQDPNQPLFMLDGFEATLQDIVNLDINRVASITLLKDAASTALYGPRSANGVVVVETVKPIPGQLRISYNITGNLAIPDLTGYNMMDAKELLAFQDALGDQGPFTTNVRATDFALKKAIRNFREYQVLRGVNTDWLSIPVRNAFALNHSLNINGGDKVFSYDIGLAKGDNKGVIKGTDASNLSGQIVLSYRKNKFNINNSFRVAGTNANGGNYGTFADYVRLPPYYNKLDDSGNLNMNPFLEYTQNDFEINNEYLGVYSYPNPLYNSSLPFRNETKGLDLTNNLQLNYDVMPWLRVSLGGQYAKKTNSADYFKSPLHTSYLTDNIVELERGQYNFQSQENNSYTANGMLTFNHVFAEKHIFNANLRADISSSNSISKQISAVGFAKNAQPLLYLANSYLPNSRPGGLESPGRSLGFTASLNYSYDQRYNMDLSYNRSGSNSFGIDNPFISFYSAGLGWNLGNEAFLKDSPIVNSLRLSANFGLTGNQYSGGFGSRSTYSLDNVSTRFGQAYHLINVANPKLEWAKTYKTSYSLNGTFFNSKLAVSLSGFHDLTDPMIIALPLAPSIGISTYPTNVGRLTTTGLDALISMKMIQNTNWTWNLGFNSPVFLHSKYSGLNELLDGFNEAARTGDYLQRYSDGSGPYDMWAVPSHGIDPSNGLEVYLDQTGKYTYKFDLANERLVGSSRPVTQGSINTQVRYKLFTFSVYCRYVVGESKMNNALFNKIENITSTINDNQDRRALYERWSVPGDDAAYLGFTNLPLGLSDRFLLKENAFYFESISLNYDFNALLQHAKLDKKLGIKRLDFGLNLNDLFKFQLSNVRLERGLDYPFARNISFNLRASF